MTGLPPEIDTDKPHSARIYDYLLGGKDNFAADRAVAEQAIKAWPGIRVAARENRASLGRAVRFLAGEAGSGQFLDIGSGLPTALNVHEAAQAVNPAAREPGKILSDPALAQTLDFREPVALILGAVMHFVPQESDPKKIIRTLVDALPSGSYVAATHGTSEYAVR